MSDVWHTAMAHYILKDKLHTFMYLIDVSSDADRPYW